MLIRFKWPQSYTVLCMLNIAVIGIVLTNNLELQILGFMFLSFGRLMLFSCHHTYLLDVFGIANFGTLNGISSMIAAILGFSSYPLQLFALRTNYAMSFIPIGILVLLAFSFPFILRKRYNAQSTKNEQIDDQPGKVDNTLHQDQIERKSGAEGAVDNTTHQNHIRRNSVAKRVPMVNWAETVSVDADQFRYPQNVNEVISLIHANSKIRCAGALHSCAPLISSEGIIMSLTKLDKIIAIDVEKMTVRCQSGVRIHDICDALAPHNLAVGTLGTIDWQTLSGAVMTGTCDISLHTVVRNINLLLLTLYLRFLCLSTPIFVHLISLKIQEPTGEH